MNEEPTNVEKMRGLPWGIAADSANTIFAQFTFFGSAFVLFLSALGLTNTRIGLLLSLFPFFGPIAILIAPAVARFGYKRTFLTFWGIRKLFAALLLLTPIVVDSFGTEAAFTYVAAVTAAFALCRAVGETGKYPWTQEYVPNSVRGKYAATSNIFTTVAGLLAVSVAGLVIERSVALSGYMILIAAGVLFGFAAVWAYSFIPGGAPIRTTGQDQAQHRGLKDALRNRGFLSYLAGVGLITLATVPMVSFLPLFMQDEVGLSSGNVVLLQNGTLLGGLLSGYLWGWAADRYGSKPVMLSGVLFRIFLPIFWMLMPRNAVASLYFALGIAVIQGIANMGWAIGSARLLFVSLVPIDQKSDYMALYYAWIGISGAVSQIVGGRLLDFSENLSGQFLNIVLDAYSPLFLLGFTLPLLSLLMFRSTKADSPVGVGEFAGMFLRGNPFQAMGSMIRYHRARGEHAAILTTERLSRSGSPLTVDELLEALEDPRFNVRFEAVVSIARMRPDPRLSRALVELLSGSELALSVVAAWALGRIGDANAIEPLHQTLDSKYHSIQAHGARALGALGDEEVVPVLLERLTSEQDKGVQMAFAVALGQLQAVEAIDTLLPLLHNTHNQGARLELSLSLARIIGNEHYFVQLLRHVRNETGTAISQAATALLRRFSQLGIIDEPVQTVTQECALAFGHGDLAEGSALLAELTRRLPQDKLSEPGRQILLECERHLQTSGADRIEYILLSLHVMHEGWSD
jgi:MFS family permease